MSIEVKFDTPIEVNKTQYAYIIETFAEAVFHRIHNGRYYVKLVGMRYKKKFIAYLEKTTVKG